MMKKYTIVYKNIGDIKWYNLDRKGAAEEYDNYHIKLNEAMHKSNEAIDEFEKERQKRCEDLQRSL